MRKNLEFLHKYKEIGVLTLATILIIVFAIACKTQNNASRKYLSLPMAKKQDSLASVAAFEKVYDVLMHPRCMNCHPSGDIPLQGDNSQLHTMLPERGQDGRGILTMQCASCHADQGVPGDHTPPGNPSWHLPPADMKMVFQGKSAHELALQLVNPNKNGHKDMKALREHAVDTLVKSGWNMGGERELPPLTYEQFKEVWYTWIDNGAYAPTK